MLLTKLQQILDTPCNRLATLKTTFMLLCKLFLHLPMGASCWAVDNNEIGYLCACAESTWSVVGVVDRLQTNNFVATVASNVNFKLNQPSFLPCSTAW